MKAVFVDTIYWVARFKPRDPWAGPAEEARAKLGPTILVTADEILMEFLTLMRKTPALRRAAAEAVDTIMANPNVRVVAQSRDSFLRALKLYRERSDKEYSLADCAAMNIMKAEGIREALTNDHHFEQERYVALIKR